MRHVWWHDTITGQFYAVATDGAGRITSAWMHAGGQGWEAIDALDGFGPLERALAEGEIHVNDAEGGWTDELGSSLGPVQ